MLYDNLGRVRSIDAGANRVKLGYDYVANSNNIEQIAFEHRPGSPYNQYAYDNLDRLTQADYLVGLLTEGEVFGMDDLGNRTTANLRSGVDQVYATDTPNLTNRYTAIDSEPLDYDAAGNLTQDHDGYHYVYDYENRVVRIYKLDGQTEVNVAQYVYDALGRRIGKWDAVAQQATFYYHNDNWQVLAEYDYTGFLRNFIYGNYIDEALVMRDATNDYYYAHDHLYSTVALIGCVDQAWTVIERCEYDAYGKAYVMDASYTPRTASDYSNPYTFTGRQLDILDSGNFPHMHYRRRDYETYTGRFMAHDPLGYIDSLNLYQYCESNPTIWLDPYGERSLRDILQDIWDALCNIVPGGGVVSVGAVVCEGGNMINEEAKRRARANYYYGERILETPYRFTPPDNYVNELNEQDEEEGQQCSRLRL